LTACRACFAVAQEGRTAAAEKGDAEDDDERGVAKEEVHAKVHVKMVAEADVLVYIGTRQRGRSST